MRHLYREKNGRYYVRIQFPKAFKRTRSITDPKKIGELLRAIDDYQDQPSTGYALKPAPLVLVRPGELRAAE